MVFIERSILGGLCTLRWYPLNNLTLSLVQKVRKKDLKVNTMKNMYQTNGKKLSVFVQNEGYGIGVMDRVTVRISSLSYL